MAISKLLPRKVPPSKNLYQYVKDRIDYDMDANKTHNKDFVSTYMCSAESVAEEFLLSKQIYEKITHRVLPQDKDIVLYRVIQSFKPDEIDPKQANEIGYKLALEFTGGKHQFIVSTHIDKSHIHNHIEFNSVNLNCDGKFVNFKNSYRKLQRLNDKICKQYGYSVIESITENRRKGIKKKPSISDGEVGAVLYGNSFKEKLRKTIDEAILNCKDFEDFLESMRINGYEVKQGKHISFRSSEQIYFQKSYRLGEDYTEDSIRNRIKLYRQSISNVKSDNYEKINLIIDIQEKIDAGKGKGYEKWAKVFNLKEGAKTLNFLLDNGINNYSELIKMTEKYEKNFGEISTSIHQIEDRMNEISGLKKNIVNYAKTRKIYQEYKEQKLCDKEKYYLEHSILIDLHEKAKESFGKGKLPTVKQLNDEYSKLQLEKNKIYDDYKSARKQMLEYKSVKQNIEKILNIDLTQSQIERDKKIEMDK